LRLSGGRAALAVSALLPWLVVALTDLALPLALAFFLAREIVAGCNWRNLLVLVLLDRGQCRLSSGSGAGRLSAVSAKPNLCP